MMEQTKATPEQAADNGAKQDASPAGTLEALKAQLQAAEKARDEYLDLAKQTRADFENYQKRNARDLATERRFAQSPLASDLLEPLDNLERALAAASQGDKASLERVVQGVGMVQSRLLEVLRRHGVTRIDAQGKPFNSNLHQAVMQQPSAEHPPETVLQVLEPGYMLHDRLLRPARVIVSKPPE